MKKRRIWLLIPALLLGIAARASNSDPATGRGQDFVQNPHHDVSVTLKLIQVYVVDKKGNPVPGLTAADFDITDDGKPVSITDFEYHAAVFPGVADQAPVPAAAAAPAKLNRKFFLWFDFGFNDSKGVKRAKTAALHFMDSQVRPEDQVALLSSSSLTGLIVHEYLTRDNSKVRQGIESLAVGRIAGRVAELDFYLERELPGARFADPSKDSPNAEDAAAAILLEQANAFGQEVYKQQSMKFLRDFRDLAKSFRYIPGTKSLILFSGGIARSLLFGMKKPTKQFNPYGSPEDQAEFNESVLSPYGDIDVQNEFKSLIRELRASNTFIYAVNETIPTSRTSSALHGNFDLNDLQGEDFLRQMASETGGRYFHNTQDSNKAVEDIQKFTASYYVLGYPVSETWDGRYHALKIGVKDKGLQCWGTAGYFNPKPFAEYTAAEKRLNLIDLALSDDPQGRKPGELPFRAVPVYTEGGPRLALLAKIPIDPGEPMFGPKTEALAILFDEQKTVKGIKRADLAVRGPDGDRIILSGLLPVQPGTYVCRMVLRDLDSGRSARGNAAVIVPAPSFAGLSVSPPLWLAAENGARWKDLFSKEDLTAVYPFDQGSYAPILEVLGPGTAKIYGVLPVSFYGAARPEISLAAQIVDWATGSRKPVPLVVLSKTEDDHRDVYLIELATGPPVLGGCSLYLFVQDKAGFKKAFISSYGTR